MSSVLNSLCGAFDYKMDPKNRVAVPTDWRPEGCSTLYLLAGRRVELPTIKVYTLEKFQDIIEKIKSSTHYTAAKIDLFLGQISSDCHKTEINSQGKLLIPRKMCEHAQLSGKIVLVARTDYFELWNPQLYEESRIRAHDNTIDINAEFGIY